MAYASKFKSEEIDELFRAVLLLEDEEVYLGNQVESEFNDGSVNRVFGILANMNFILVSEYGPHGGNPEIIIYKKR